MAIKKIFFLIVVGLLALVYVDLLILILIHAKTAFEILALLLFL